MDVEAQTELLNEALRLQQRSVLHYSLTATLKAAVTGSLGQSKRLGAELRPVLQVTGCAP
jgi:hypothetical protein